MQTPTGVDDATIEDIDEALANLRESIRAFDGDRAKQGVVLTYVDELLDMRHQLRTGAPA